LSSPPVLSAIFLPALFIPLHDSTNGFPVFGKPQGTEFSLLYGQICGMSMKPKS
jgi:hypothetical protein